MNISKALNTPFWDDYGTRYRLIQDNPEKYNWLFIPGGPGADSIYLLTLIKLLDLPGHVWLVDFPGNGGNKAPNGYDYREWFDLFVPMVKNFEHPIIVGHSFGAIIPQMCPELEGLLDGFIAINSTPSLWFTQAAQARQKFNIPDIPERTQFLENPGQETLDRFMTAQLPYFFKPDTLERGRAMFTDFTYSYQVALDVIAILQDMPYQASWTPQQVKTLIIGGELDAIHPHSLFTQDINTNRPNIKKVEIQGAGHWSWIDKPDTVKELFNQFITELPE